MSELAINGGAPVRTEPFPSNLPGASVLGSEEMALLEEVIKERSPFRFYGIGNPNKVATFEKMVCEQFGVKYALAVSSGTSAISCAIAALGFGPGDEVIIPSFSWYSDYCTLLPFGILPVFADIGDDLNLDPEDFEKKITKNTKAVIVVHYQGTPAKMDEIVAVARKHNLVIIEDCAQAFGGSYKGQRLGLIGDIATASFQTHKMITCGEGGLVFTNNEEYFIRAVRYHDLGNVRPYFLSLLDHPENAQKKDAFAGLQLRMSELQGAVLCAQFAKLEDILKTTRKYHAELREYVCSKYPKLKVRYQDGDCGIAFIMLMDSKEEADKFSAAMKAEGIPCGPTSACPNLLANEPISNRGVVNENMPPFGKGFVGENVFYDATKDCLHTNEILDRFVAIGIGPTYTDKEISDIKAALDKVLPSVL